MSPLLSFHFNEAHCLDRLFAPVTREDFLARHWPEQHAVAHGPVGRLDALAALPDLDGLLRVYEDQVRVALADKRDEHSSRLVDPAEAAQLHADGMALIFNSVERFLPPVQYWLDALRTELSLPLKCDPRSIVYASPKGSGNSPHFDANANFVVQLKGTKLWRLAPNRHVVNPTDRWAMNQDDLPEELEAYVEDALPNQMPADALTFSLTPGSVLFVPRGYWHETESNEDTLALNFTFGQPTWADLMLTALRTRLLKHPQWRALARPERAQDLLAALAAEAAKLEPDELADALDTQSAWLLVPRGFVRIEGDAVVASLGEEQFAIDAEPALHPVLEWIGRQRTPFSVEQLALHFPPLTPGLPGLLHELRSRGLLGKHHCRPSPNRD